jgi:hypothetical protein
MLIVMLLACGIATAHAGFYTYSTWASLAPAARAAYIAGAYDSFVGFGTEKDMKRIDHYNDCVARSQMNHFQLADNVLAYAKTRPEIQAHTVMRPLLAYLEALCGPVQQ